MMRTPHFLGQERGLPIGRECPCDWLFYPFKIPLNSLFFCPLKWTAYIMTSRDSHLAGGLSNKKARAYYYSNLVQKNIIHPETWSFILKLLVMGQKQEKAAKHTNNWWKYPLAGHGISTANLWSTGQWYNCYTMGPPTWSALQTAAQHNLLHCNHFSGIYMVEDKNQLNMCEIRWVSMQEMVLCWSDRHIFSLSDICYLPTCLAGRVINFKQIITAFLKLF